MKGILFSTPMVQAILDGRKTQTRRVIKEEIPFPQGTYPAAWKYHYWAGSPFNSQKKLDPPRHELVDGIGRRILLKPKYKKGDILYVRETWMPFDTMESESDELDQDGLNKDAFLVQFGYRAGGEPKWATVAEDFHEKMVDVIDEMEQEGEKWKPSLFMPKAAARIFLKVTDVRAERLQDITEEDAIAEGVWLDTAVLPNAYTLYGMPHWRSAVECFRDLWDSINAKTSSWEKNDWVWVYKFEKIQKP